MEMETLTIHHRAQPNTEDVAECLIAEFNREFENYDWRDTYVTSIYMTTTPIGNVEHIRVERRDGRDGISWDDLQRIKNDLVGSDAFAVELYPPEHEVVNEVNARHLWVLPSRATLPVGWRL